MSFMHSEKKSNGKRRKSIHLLRIKIFVHSFRGKNTNQISLPILQKTNRTAALNFTLVESNNNNNNENVFPSRHRLRPSRISLFFESVRTRASGAGTYCTFNQSKTNANFSLIFVHTNARVPQHRKNVGEASGRGRWGWLSELTLVFTQPIHDREATTKQ